MTDPCAPMPGRQDQEQRQPSVRPSEDPTMDSSSAGVSPSNAPAGAMEYELHPLCAKFPPLSGAAFISLRDDIAANGLRQPIVLHEGKILDGRNRDRACREAGVEREFIEFDGPDAVSFVLSANLHRRHLSAGQQAVAVALVQNWANAHVPGSNQHRSKGGSATLQDQVAEASTSPELTTVAARAAQARVSDRTQGMADKVAKERPELAQKVLNGEVTLPAAAKLIDAKPGQPKRRAPRSDMAALQQELDEVREQNDELREQNAELHVKLEEAAEERASMARVLEADDRVAAALAESRNYWEQVRQLDERVRGLQNERMT